MKVAIVGKYVNGIKLLLGGIMTSKRIIRIYLLITGLFTLSASLIWGINTLFLMDAGLDIYQVFIVNAVHTGAMAVFEIPTGVFADTLGRRYSFIMSTIVLSIGTFGYVWAAGLDNNMLYFSLMSIVLGLAFTFYTGAVEAWIVDALNSTGYKGKMDSIFAKAGMITNITMLIGTISGGFIGTYSLKLPYVIRAVTLLLAASVAFVGMKELGFTPRALELKKIPEEMKKVTVDSLKYGLHHDSVKLHMILSFIFSGFMMWGWYAWQPLFLELYGDMAAVWVAGTISAGVSICQIIANFNLERIMKFFKTRTSLMSFSYTVQAVTIVIIGLSNSFVISVTSFMVFAFFMGLSMPVKQSYIHSLIPSDKRATIISFDSLVGSGGSVIGQMGLGYLSKVMSIPFGYLVGGIVLVARIPVVNRLKKRKDPEDLLKEI